MNLVSRISPHLFLLLSLAPIMITVAVSGTVLSNFFRQAILDREGKIIADFAHALASRDITAEDFRNFSGNDAQMHFSRSFGMLRDIADVVRLKAINLSGVIIWSDDESLIGKTRTHSDKVKQAAAGGSAVEFFREDMSSSQLEDPHDPVPPFVDFFVPIRVHDSTGMPPVVVGVLSIYRSSASLNATLEGGVRLVWLVTAFGGIALFGAQFTLFLRVWRGRQEAESRLMRLSDEHQRIIHLEKLSATGAMVAEIAHQINNPLVGVINLSELAAREADLPWRTRELLIDIRSAGQHCSDFVKRMLEFTKAARCERHPVHLSSLVAETVALFQSSTPGHPAVEIRQPEHASIILADPVLVRHALFNILTNAFHACPEMAIQVELAPETRGAAERAGWRLEVADHGPGIPEYQRELIFTPFFSTRPNGMGLGLSVVEHIMIQHGGDVTIKDTPGGGARFLLWFPENTTAGVVA